MNEIFTIEKGLLGALAGEFIKHDKTIHDVNKIVVTGDENLKRIDFQFTDGTNVNVTKVVNVG